jgi:hypothetical protein
MSIYILDITIFCGKTSAITTIDCGFIQAVAVFQTTVTVFGMMVKLRCGIILTLVETGLSNMMLLGR